MKKLLLMILIAAVSLTALGTTKDYYINYCIDRFEETYTESTHRTKARFHRACSNSDNVHSARAIFHATTIYNNRMPLGFWSLLTDKIYTEIDSDCAIQLMKRYDREMSSGFLQRRCFL